MPKVLDLEFSAALSKYPSIPLQGAALQNVELKSWSLEPPQPRYRRLRTSHIDVLMQTVSLDMSTFEGMPHIWFQGLPYI